MSAFHLRLAADRLNAGGIIAHPTEGVFGLACDPHDEAAIIELLRLKRRAPEQGLILVGGELHQLRPFWDAAKIDETALERYWPGPTTLVLPSAASTSALLTGGRRTVALRLTAHPQFRALCTVFGGALVSTSANRSGRPPAATALGARRQFGSRLDQVLSGSLTHPGRPTPILDITRNITLRA